MRNSYYSHPPRRHHQQDRLVPHPSGVIFMCNNETISECFRRRIFGLPASREPFVRLVKEGMYLFLFNTDVRKMHGVFKAASNGGMNIVPEAYSSGGKAYPAQVQFKEVCICEPLRESEFKPAIQKKYFTDKKFNLDLNSDQVERLLHLFEAKIVIELPQLAPSSYSPLSPSSSSRDVQVYSPNPHYPGNILIRGTSSNFYSGSRLHDQVCDSRSHPSSYSPLSLSSSSRDVQVYSPNPRYPGNILIRGTSSNFYSGSRLHDQVCDSRSHPSSYSPLSPSSSSRDVQVYSPNPRYPGNILIRGTSSNFYSGSRLHDQVCDSRSHSQGQFYNQAHQNLHYSYTCHFGNHKTRLLTRKCCSYQNPGVISTFYPSELRNQLQENSSSKNDPNFSLDSNWCRKPYLNPNPRIHLGAERRKSVFSRLTEIAEREREPGQTGGDPTMNQLPDHLIQQSSHQTRLHRADEPVYRNWVVQDQELEHIDELASSENKADSGMPGVVDGMMVDPTTPASNLTVEPGNIQVPFMNFKRRYGGNKLSNEMEGDKKRRFIRPSLVLQDEDSETKFQPEHVAETKSDGSQMILVSGPEKLGTSELVIKSLNKEEANFSEGHTGSLVLGETAEKEKTIPDPEHANSEPKVEISYSTVHQPEPDNSKFSMCSHNEKSSLVEEYIPLEPEDDFLENNYPVEDYIALEPDAGNRTQFAW